MSIYLQELPIVNLTHIISEVRTHGFCVMHCSALVKQPANLDEMKTMIWQLAKPVGLKVSFNDEKMLCVFEQR